jgi:hypothetical protein
MEITLGQTMPQNYMNIFINLYRKDNKQIKNDSIFLLLW